MRLQVVGFCYRKIVKVGVGVLVLSPSSSIVIVENVEISLTVPQLKIDKRGLGWTERNPTDRFLGLL